MSEIKSQESEDVGLVLEFTRISVDVANTLQGEHQGSTLELVTHQGGDGTSRHTYPPYNMPIFTQFPQDQSSASKWSQECSSRLVLSVGSCQ